MLDGYLQDLQPQGRKHSLGSGWQAHPSEMGMCFSEGNSLMSYCTSDESDECNMQPLRRTTFTLEVAMQARFAAITYRLFGSNPSVELSVYSAVACLM